VIHLTEYLGVVWEYTEFDTHSEGFVLTKPLH